MLDVFDDMVAVASGTAVQVKGWAALLQAQPIRTVIATSCQPPAKDAANHVELWVEKKDAERARKLLRESTPGNGAFLW